MVCIFNLKLLHYVFSDELHLSINPSSLDTMRLPIAVVVYETALEMINRKYAK